MTATAGRNKDTEPSVMSAAAEKISEAMLVLMQIFGIKRLECRKLKSADFERILTDVQKFDCTPPEIESAGVLVKDAMMQILAAAGIVKLEIEATDEDMKSLDENYKAIVNAKFSISTENSSDDKMTDVATANDEVKDKAST